MTGPDFRGGSYLLGLQKAKFQQENFAALPWQTEHLAPALAQYLFCALHLTSRRDWNNGVDVCADQHLLAGYSDWTFLLQLKELTSIETNLAQPTLAGFGESCPRRGPPSMA